MIRLLVVFAFLLAALVPARAPGATWNLSSFDGREYVPMSDVSQFYKLGLRFNQAGAHTQVLLSSPGRSLRGSVNSKEFFINEVKFILSFPLLAVGDMVYLSRNDLTKLIEPVLRPHRLRNLGAINTIILDPGHGGHDRGATSAFGVEKDFALDVALRAREMLRRRGFRVLLTRQADYFIPLEERTRFANQYRDNGLFVSIHFNAGSGVGTGIETYLMAPRLVPSYNGDGAPNAAELQQWPGNVSDPENMALATAMHSAMLSRLPLDDRGIKRARFHVLRMNDLPSVLLEGGFVSNAEEAQKIAQPEFRRALAEAIVVAIDNFKAATQDQPTAPPVARGDTPQDIERIIREARVVPPSAPAPAQSSGSGPKVSVPSQN